MGVFLVFCNFFVLFRLFNFFCLVGSFLTLVFQQEKLSRFSKSSWWYVFGGDLKK